MYEEKIVCPYQEKCFSYPMSCAQCFNNGSKLDYFKPIPQAHH